MKSYRFLLFDADHTLLDFDKDMLQAFEAAYHKAGLDKFTAYTAELHHLYNEYNNLWWKRFDQGQCSKEELYVGRFRDFLGHIDMAAEPETVNDAYFSCLSENGTAYAGAAELLERLSKNHECYLITNGSAVTQPGRLECSGLNAYYKEFFVSESVGAGKPDIRYFNYVAEHIPGFSQDQALVIGDSLSSDIQGAVNAGIDSIWFNPNRLPAPASPVPTYMAACYEEILNIVGE